MSYQTKTLKLVLWVLATFAVVNAQAQCTLVVPSTNGYEVHLSLKPSYIIAPATCPNGYNYNVGIEYDISFAGSNVPASLYTLQGNLGCGSNTNIFFNLPNGGGTGITETTGNPYTNKTDCTTATVETLGCTDIELTIQGPGISTQKIYCSAALPIELAYFQAVERNGQVELNWQTITELNNDFFTLERSRDGKSWQTIRQINGAGTSTVPLVYQDWDKAPYSGVSYYRLKQTDFDGQYSYSPIEAVHINQEKMDIVVFPNPVTHVMTVRAEEQELSSFRIFDSTGKEVGLSDISVQKAGKEVIVDMSALTAGMYYVKTYNHVQKIIKR